MPTPARRAISSRLTSAPALGEGGLRGLQQPLAVAQRVGARLARALLRLSLDAPAGAAGSPLARTLTIPIPLINGGTLRI